MSVCLSVCRPQVCHSLGRKVDNVKAKLSQKFDEAACCQPSIILLENLDDLVAAPAAGAIDGGIDALYTTKLAESETQVCHRFIPFHSHIECLNAVICGLINCELQRRTVVTLMATARSADALHPRLLPGRGRHYFQKVLELKIPTEVDSRRSI